MPETLLVVVNSPDKALRRGSFNSVPDLITAIEDYLDAYNEDPKALQMDRHRRIHPGKGSPAARPGRP